MRTTFLKTLLEAAEFDDRIFIVTPDMGFSVFEPFIEKHPDQFLNVGIAEQNAAGVAAGLALSGYKVFLYSIVPFVTMRCFEQVRVDIAYMQTNVTLVGVGGGLSYGPAGATHHAIEDVALMRSLPSMRVCCPGDPIETEHLIQYSLNTPGPMYVRLGKNNEPRIHLETDEIEFGRASILRRGTEFAVLAMGNMLETTSKWVSDWVNEGYDPLFASLHTMKPFDELFIKELVESGMPIITVEEHNLIGGLASAVAEVVVRCGSKTVIETIGIDDTYSHYVGSHDFLRNRFGLSKRPDIERLLKGKSK
jgi:transketolase